VGTKDFSFFLISNPVRSELYASASVPLDRAHTLLS
jgi:hypothetical protein